MGVLKRGLVVFWAGWWSVVLITNAADGLRALGVAPGDIAFASGNFALIVQAVGTYGLPRGVAGALFAAVVLLQVGIASLFWRAAIDGGLRSAPRRDAARAAFAAGTGLVATFLLADEIFLLYHSIPGVEGTHWRVFLAHLASLLVLELLREPALSAADR